MSENIVRLGKAEVHSARRESFLATIAQSFERYVADYGFEPDALVFTFCGVRQPSVIAWDIQGESQGGVSSVLSLAAIHAAAEAQTSRQGLPQ